jgi:transposase
VHRKRPELWLNNWILHHDNNPVHNTLSVKQFLSQKLITEMEHPPYSPDLAPNDLWLFQKMSALKRQRFQDTEDIQKSMMTELKAIPQQKFQKCSQQQEHHWAKCISAQGKYFRDNPYQ